MGAFPLTARIRRYPIRYLYWAAGHVVCLLLTGCFSALPVLPPREALAKAAEHIQRVLDEERREPVEPVQTAKDVPADVREVSFWFCTHPLISHAILAHPERVRAFASSHPGLAFNHQFIGDWSVAIQKLTVSLAAGDVPDVALVKRAWLARLIDSGWAAPIDEWLPPAMADDFRPEAVAPLKRNGHLYALPADGFCSILYFDKTKLAGTVPATWSTLRERARTLTQPNADTYQAVYGIGAMPFLESLWSAGGDVCDETACLLGTDAAREAVDFVTSLYTDGLAHPRAAGDPLGALGLLLSGHVAMTVASSEYLSRVRNAPFPMGFAPVPGQHGGISQQSDNVLVVFARYARAKQAAIAEVLDFLTGPAVQDPDAFQAGSVPTRKSLATVGKIPEGLEAAYAVSRNAPLVPAWAAIAYELDSGLERCAIR